MAQRYFSEYFSVTFNVPQFDYSITPCNFLHLVYKQKKLQKRSSAFLLGVFNQSSAPKGFFYSTYSTYSTVRQNSQDKTLWILWN